MKLLNPIQGVSEEEVAHLETTVIEDVRPPLGVITQSGIFMFIAGCAIETAQRPVVLGEMRGHPVQQYPDTGAMHEVNKGAKIIRRPMPRRGGEVTAYLIAP